MKYTEILESASDKVTLANGRAVHDDEKSIQKVLADGKEIVLTKHKGELIRFGQDEDKSDEYFVAGRLPKDFKIFKNFKLAYDFWYKKYRK